MTLYIAEFVLDSDLSIPENEESIKWIDSNIHLEICNTNEIPKRVVNTLKAHLKFESENLTQAKEDCQDILAKVFNSLCLITSCSIRQSELKRIVDWSDGLVMRDALYFHRSLRIAIPEEALAQDVLESACKLSPALHSERAQTALRWFRIGLSLSSPEEQFMHFWFALENAAEALKGEERIAHQCPECEAELACSRCGKIPTHRKFSADAIKDLIFSAVNEDAQKEVFKTAIAVRHALMHGRRMASALKKSDMNEVEVTNLVAGIARHSLFKLVDSTMAPIGTFAALQSADVVRSDMVAAGHIQSVFGPADKPSLSANEGIKISVVYPGEESDRA